MIQLLEETECTVRHISQVLRIGEKQVYQHLEHVRRSVAADKKRLAMNPARCLGCGYVFENRSRLTKPGRCPVCKKGPISPPSYKIHMKP